jgi:Photosynthetic reaction centre cytochrome C subunit
LRPSTDLLPFVVAAFIAVTITTPILNAHSAQNGNENSQQAHAYPKPTNLKVLPKDLDGAQVREIMRQWEEALGADCATCHIRDPRNLGPNGRPQFNYADDSKPEKAAARLMYSMVEDINVNYVAKVENSGVPVSCGTCHRGRIGPEPFSTTEKNEGVTK